MGYFSKALISEIRPTQDYLFQDCIEKYLTKVESNKPVLIPVLEDLYSGCDSKYAALDGHHKASSLLGIFENNSNSEINVWIASSPKDFIPYENNYGLDKKDVDHLNFEIKRRFNNCQFYIPCNSLGNEIKSFEELIKSTGINL
jgi:hypothetical protein